MESSDSKQCPQKNLLDIDQPFLLYEAYSSRQVIASTLENDPETSVFGDQNLKKTGPALLIPESYPGELRLTFTTEIAFVLLSLFESVSFHK